MRRCTERDADAITFSDPNRDRYANSHSNGNSYSNCDAWTAPTQGPEEKDGGNEYGASQLEGGNLAQHRRLPQ